MAGALDGADFVLSICPPANAEDVAHAVAGYTGVFVEANAIARGPHGADRLAAPPRSGGGRWHHRRTARSGRHHAAVPLGDVTGVAELFAGTALEVVALPGGVGGASALKMAFASYQNDQ